MKLKVMIIEIIAGVIIGQVVGTIIGVMYPHTSGIITIAISVFVSVVLILIADHLYQNKKYQTKDQPIQFEPSTSFYQVTMDDIPKATLTLSKAFKDDPLFKKIYGDSEKSEENFRLLSEALLKYTVKYGDVYATSENMEGIISILQNEHVNMTVVKLITSGAMMPMIKSSIKAKQGSSSFMDIDKFRKAFMKNKAYVYIQIFGVMPKYQGKGYGKSLINFILNECEKNNRPVFLETETETDVSIYQHFGFEVVHQLQMKNIDHSMWMMVKMPNIQS